MIPGFRSAVGAVLLLCLAGTVGIADPNSALQITEPFAAHVLTSGLQAPWELVWGPDNWIWVTEREGARVTRVNPRTGEKKVAIKLNGVDIGSPQEGLLGLALSPTLLEPGGAPYAYVVYTYLDGQSERAKIVRLTYDQKSETLADPHPLIEGMPAGDDHNAGRIIFGHDGKLYYTIGDQGHNQGRNSCKPIEAQRIPTSEELEAKNYAAYTGKTLRLNPDGGIPEDNPLFGGVRSHLFTIGHRNPQGLVEVNGVLFSTEQGPSSDDELNILVSGGNYGWPYVAGFKDDRGYVYANYSAAPDCASLPYDPIVIPKGVPVQKESDWSDPNFHPPIKTFYTVDSDYNFFDHRCPGALRYLCWPTIAPSSVTYYPVDGSIARWRNSLLITSLKNGQLYRLPMNADMKDVQGDVVVYFHTENRYRAVLVDKQDTSRIYIATDVRGNTMGDGGRPVTKLANPGSIIVFSAQ